MELGERGDGMGWVGMEVEGYIMGVMGRVELASVCQEAC